MKKGKRKPRVSMARSRERVQWLEAKLKRPIRPGDIVKDAKNQDTPYHLWFTWNREKGFQKNLLHEARQLLGRLTVIYRDLSGNEVSVRKYVNMRLEAPATHTFTRAYLDRGHTMKNAGLHQQMVESAVQQLEIFKRHFRTFKKIEVCFYKIDEAIGILKRARFKKVAVR